MPRRDGGYVSVVAQILAGGSVLRVLLPTSLLHATAFRVLDQSASAVAQADDPSAVFDNQLG